MNRNNGSVQGAASQDPAQTEDKAPWQRPQLMRMGHLKDFVQGGGKGGSTFDMDPNGSGKSGIG